MAAVTSDAPAQPTKIRCRSCDMPAPHTTRLRGLFLHGRSGTRAATPGQMRPWRAVDAVDPSCPPPLRTRLRPRLPVDLRLTLFPLWRGGRDPSMRLADGEVWRATRTPLVAATLRLRAADGGLCAEAWGPGAPWALEGAAALAGQLDDDS